MKRFISKLTFLCFFMLSGPIAFTQLPMNWTRDEINPGEDFTLSPDESFFTEGLKSLHLQLNSGAVPYLVSEVFYITPGEAYEFSVDVFDNDTAGQVKIYADFYDTYGFNIFGQPPVFSADSADWQTISWQGTVPSQSVVGYILIKFYTQPDLYHFIKQANAWIDNVRFEQSPGVNLVTNGGFEDWNVGIEENGNVYEALSVYPNPAKDFIHIDLPGNFTEIIVSDITGREIHREDLSGRNQIQVDVNGWHEGIYIINSVLDNRIVSTQKLIVL
jgi:hypothetical protein